MPMTSPFAPASTSSPESRTASTSPLASPPTLERYPELDAFAEHAALNAQCSLTSDALARYFLDDRPLCSAAARKHGISWTSILRSEHGPLELPEGTRAYLAELRQPYGLRLL